MGTASQSQHLSKMMKFIVVAVCLIAAVLAAPQHPSSRDAQITFYTNDNIGLGQYNYNVETSDGISKKEEGQLVNPGSEQEAIAVRGSYSYTGDDGVVYTVEYIADENGFQPLGAHLPKSQ